jgi:hypothetical protein
MAQWGNTDDAANSVSYAVNQFKVTANSDNQTAFFGNTTQSGIMSGVAVGQFGAATAEAGVDGGPVVDIVITNPGSGYSANATVTLTAVNGGSSAVANGQVGATGRIAALNVSTAGSGYKSSPTVTVSAPTAVVFNGNTNVASNLISITSANSKFIVGDRVKYAGNTTSTPGGLVDNTYYYISFSNTTVVALSATPGGANIALTDASGDSTTAGGATLQGETATGVASVGGGKNKGITHAGWVVRTEGSGGRAGRVQYETLVAMGSLTSDASDDTVLPDA